MSAYAKVEKSNEFVKLSDCIFDGILRETSKTLTVNCLSDQALTHAREQGYYIPCINISHKYGHKAIFKNYYLTLKNGNKVLTKQLEIIGNDGKLDCMYSM